ncbi:MAG TPA: YqaE/Pmp3 family membrane protein [Phycisphaerales bacterium]|nr:YqaE/Pmp3 family membrane protein [Phycisphaerales bacterium]
MADAQSAVAASGSGVQPGWWDFWKETSVRYLLCIVLPPVAVLTTGRWVQAIINIVLTILGWVPGVVHAALIVHDFKEEQRTNRIIDAVRAARVA